MSKKKPTAKNNLFNMDIVEVARASVPAVPQATFAVFKNADLPLDKQIFKQVHFHKNDVKKQVYGYLLVPNIPDHQGDIATVEAIEKACHSYMRNLALRKAKGSGTSGNHIDFSDGESYPIACVIDTDGAIGKAHDLPEEQCYPGGWWFGMQCSDDAWSAIEKGEFTGFSIGGSGDRSPIEEQDPGTMKSLVRSLQSLVAKLMDDEDGPVTFQESYEEQIDEDKLWEMQRAIGDAVRSILRSSETNKIQLLTQSVNQYLATLISFVTANKSLDVTKLTELCKILKTGSSNSDKGGGDMNQKELQALVDKVTQIGDGVEKLQDLPERVKTLEDFQKSLQKVNTDPANPDDKGVDKGDPNKNDITDPVLAKLDDITKRLDKIEKKPEVRKGGDQDTDGEDPQKPSVAKRLLFGAPGQQ